MEACKLVRTLRDAQEERKRGKENKGLRMHVLELFEAEQKRHQKEKILAEQKRRKGKLEQGPGKRGRSRYSGRRKRLVTRFNRRS